MVFPGSEGNPIQADIKIKIHPNKPSPLCNSLHNLGFVQRRIRGTLKAAPCITSTQIPFILCTTRKTPNFLPHSSGDPKLGANLPILRAGMDPPRNQQLCPLEKIIQERSTAFPLGKMIPERSTALCFGKKWSQRDQQLLPLEKMIPERSTGFPFGKNDPRESHVHLLLKSHLFPGRLFPQDTEPAMEVEKARNSPRPLDLLLCCSSLCIPRQEGGGQAGND